MKILINIPTLFFILTFAFSGCMNTRKDASAFSGLDGPRNRILADFGWKFYRGDTLGAGSMDFNDASWRDIDLPHDWSVEDIPGKAGPLDSSAVGGIDMGYFPGGTGWYRKVFNMPSGMQSQRVYLLFEGIYMDPEIWINGELVGNHPYGYTSFWLDISGKLHYGKKNTLAVKVKNEGRNSRWYTGSGIYRHVWFIFTGPVHIAPWGTAVITPTASPTHATVSVKNEIMNTSGDEQKLSVITRILDGEGKTVASGQKETRIMPDQRLRLGQDLDISEPALWSTDSPSLYTAVTEVRDSGSVLLDRVETPFGVRSVKFSTEGFFLNGRPMVLKGACMHHDNGPLGAAAWDRAEERRVEIMKANGYNCIRCAHNPPSPAFLDACDRLGMMVICEAFDMWREPKNPEDYHRFFDEWWKTDMESMVKRDINHPSVIMWSIGNEIPERSKPEGVETAKMLSDFVKSLDPGRPVTSAVNGLNPDKDAFFATLDVAGYNYAFQGDPGAESIVETDHRRVPERIIYNSESYPLTAFGAWMDVVDHPYVVGDFVWTGFDYLGEASIGWLGYPHTGSFYPWNHAYCGDIDICGMKRPQSYYRNILWNSGEQLSLFVQPPRPSFEENPGRMEWSKWHWQDVTDRWNWEGHENERLNVEVYCGYDKAELLLNGKSLGIKETNRDSEWIARWEVPYSPGVLMAVGYSGDRAVDTAMLRTAGKPVAISLACDRDRIGADGQDLSYITVELVDGAGNRNRSSGDRVDFSIEGPGTIAAVASSNPMSTESFRQPYRQAWNGRCMVVVRSARQQGEITLTASAQGLKSAAIKIKTD